MKALFVVSADLPASSSAGGAAAAVPLYARGPRKDYAAIAAALDADTLDRTAVEHSRSARIVARVCGVAAAQAWLAFRRRRGYDAIVTDGEHIGIPLALLLKLSGSRAGEPAHVTIGHRLTAKKKRPFFRWLRVQSHITRVIVHSSRQRKLAQEALGFADDQLALLPYQVDTAFWRPQPVTDERLISSAGLEFRDYPTLVEATAGLDAQVTIAAASHWSRRRNTAAGSALPPNVDVRSFDYFGLRSLYARSAVVVVPLDEVEFQAGITCILEAMAMGKPVIVTHTEGQTDAVEDRRADTRGASDGEVAAGGEAPRPRPASMLRVLAEEAGLSVEPNGFYVPPRDPGALSRAIAYLLARPDERARLGGAGRRAVERFCTVEQFAQRVRAVVEDACRPVRLIPVARTSAA